MFFIKITAIFQTLYGWMCAACLFLLNLIEGYEAAIASVVVTVALDTAWGIAAQLKRGRFALSALGREGMLSKWMLYASVLIAFIHIERMADIDSHITVIVICTLISLVEVWSMSGSALIINPRMPFLRLFRRVLAGEIAHKLNIAEEEVEEVLERHPKTDQTHENNRQIARVAKQQPAEYSQE